MKTIGQQHSWDDYVAEAEHEPFLLNYRVPGDDDTEPEIRTITLGQPNSIQMMRIAEGVRNGDAEAIMVGLCGDAWPEVYELLSRPNVGFSALLRLEKDLLAWFQLNDEVELRGPGGGTRRVSDPQEVQKLLRLGWVSTGN